MWWISAKDTENCKYMSNIWIFTDIKIDQLADVKLASSRAVGLQEMHVHVADKCELGVYSCFNIPEFVSHIFKEPSALV